MSDSTTSLPGLLESRGSQSQIHIHHHHHYHRRASSDGTATTQGKRDHGGSGNGPSSTYQSLKSLTLNNLNAKQHFFIAVCRDVSLLPPLLSLAHALKKAWVLSYRADVLSNTADAIADAIAISVSQMDHSYRALKTQASSADSELTSQLVTARSSEYLLCSLWCVVAAYLTYSILDSLMVRWIVKYSTVAAILRMFSMSLLIVTLEMLLLSSLSPKGDYYLHTWILICCLLTGAYIWQSFLTSDLNYVEHETPPGTPASNTTAASTAGPTGPTGPLHRRTSSSHSISNPSHQVTCDTPEFASRKRRRGARPALRLAKHHQIHLYNITVFCVVPVGLASFITMIGLLRNLVIQRLDLEQLERMLTQGYSE
ncbi:LADA_0E09318g1_1 [Lachancea dasiensis]|uniref:LADA_0E09318g1_1 n=1 Tax=Lachancea dasiensis TaxID=1072105 RepID=A0A1G4JDT7_9SACH|nr:LADA_0E09318g1_1 [Lachancea dasiensis]